MRTKQDTMPGGLRQERRACCGGISSGQMKGIRAAVLALGGAFLLAGCGGESGVLAPIPAEGFSQGVYDALEENWTAWESVD